MTEAQNLLIDVKAALADAGMPAPDDTEIIRALGKAVVQGLPSDHTAIWHIGEDELVRIGDGLASVLRFAGMKGAALDQALHDTFTAAIRAIDAERAAQETRRTKLTVV